MSIPIPKLAANVMKQPAIFSSIKRNSAIWKPKLPDLKNIKSESLGYVCQDGSINFLNQNAALEYAKNKVVRTAKLGYESGTAIKGNRIVFQASGDTKGVLRDDSIVYDIGVHSHPDTYAKGCTAAPSIPDYEILMKKPFQKKEIVFNSNGEYYSLTKLPDYNYDLNANLRKEAFFEYVKGVGKILKEKIPESMRAEYSEAVKNKDTSKMVDILEDCMYFRDNNVISKAEVEYSHKFWQKHAERLGVEAKTNFSNFK